jgi:hypothetical protein
VTPIFLFAINLIGFFHVDCPTLSKINWAVFCQWSLLNLILKFAAENFEFVSASGEDEKGLHSAACADRVSALASLTLA